MNIDVNIIIIFDINEQHQQQQQQHGGSVSGGSTYLTHRTTNIDERACSARPPVTSSSYVSVHHFHRARTAGTSTTRRPRRITTTRHERLRSIRFDHLIDRFPLFAFEPVMEEELVAGFQRGAQVRYLVPDLHRVVRHEVDEEVEVEERVEQVVVTAALNVVHEFLEVLYLAHRHAVLDGKRTGRTPDERVQRFQRETCRNVDEEILDRHRSARFGDLVAVTVFVLVEHIGDELFT